MKKFIAWLICFICLAIFVTIAFISVLFSLPWDTKKIVDQLEKEMKDANISV